MHDWWQEWKKPQVCITLLTLLFVAGGAWVRLGDIEDGQDEFQEELIRRLENLDGRLTALQASTNEGDKALAGSQADFRALVERVSKLERFDETQAIINQETRADVARLEERRP